MKFEKYLDKVRTDHPDEYTEINDILNRYHMLDKANKDLQS